MPNLTLLDQVLKTPLARMLAWPHSPESYLDFLAPRLGGKSITARIKAVQQQTPRAVSLVLEPNHRWQRHEAGQYLTLTVTLNGRRHSRCFTISHVEAGCPVLTLQAHEGGLVAQWANESAWVGDTVEISPAMGDFVLPAKRPSRLLFIAGGSGITPIRALTDQLMAEGWQGQADILYYVTSRQDAIFLTHFEALAQALPNFRLHLVCTREQADPGRLQGHFSAHHLAAIAADIAHSLTYVCGPAGLIAAVENHWQHSGQRDRLRLERFRPASHAVASGASQAVTFSHSQRQASSNGQTLLETAEGAGLNPTFGCRQGICRTCTCRKTAGRVRDIRSGEISDEGEADIALCVSVPVTPVTLAL